MYSKFFRKEGKQYWVKNNQYIERRQPHKKYPQGTESSWATKRETKKVYRNARNVYDDYSRMTEIEKVPSSTAVNFELLGQKKKQQLMVMAMSNEFVAGYLAKTGFDFDEMIKTVDFEKNANVKNIVPYLTDVNVCDVNGKHIIYTAQNSEDFVTLLEYGVDLSMLDGEELKDFVMRSGKSDMIEEAFKVGAIGLTEKEVDDIYDLSKLTMIPMLKSYLIHLQVERLNEKYSTKSELSLENKDEKIETEEKQI